MGDRRTVMNNAGQAVLKNRRQYHLQAVGSMLHANKALLSLKRLGTFVRSFDRVACYTCRGSSRGSMKKGCLGRTILAGCGKTTSAQQNLDGLYAWDTRRTSPQDAQKGRPARPQRAKRRRRTLRYVEPLNDARTPLAGLFSILLACACTVVLVGAVVGPALAAQKKSKVQAPSVVPAVSPKPSPALAQKPRRATAKETAVSTVPEQQPEVLQRQAKQTPTGSKTTGRKGHRQVKVSKKIPPKAVVQPRTDLMYHGMIEDAQRYDPRPNHHTAGVRNPQTSDLTHDHFQELDRNQDGTIDPVERAFSRLDMDRDLYDRQPR